MIDRYDIKTCADTGFTVSASYRPIMDRNGEWVRYDDVTQILAEAFRAGMHYARTPEGGDVCDRCETGAIDFRFVENVLEAQNDC